MGSPIELVDQVFRLPRRREVAEIAAAESARDKHHLLVAVQLGEDLGELCLGPHYLIRAVGPRCVRSVRIHRDQIKIGRNFRDVLLGTLVCVQDGVGTEQSTQLLGHRGQGVRPARNIRAADLIPEEHTSESSVFAQVGQNVFLRQGLQAAFPAGTQPFAAEEDRAR